MKKVLSILLVVITIISSFAFATNTFAASVPISCNDIYVKYISNGRAYIHFKWSSKNKKPFKNVEFFCICKDKEVDVNSKCFYNASSGEYKFNVPQGNIYTIKLRYVTQNSKGWSRAIQIKTVSVSLNNVPEIKEVYLENNKLYMRTRYSVPCNQGLRWYISDVKSFSHYVGDTSTLNGPNIPCKPANKREFLLGKYSGKYKLKKGKTYYIKYVIINNRTGTRTSKIKSFKL